ncbi:MAG TPA: dephospho-CoA kinase [Intrasporangium sp.]|uniref:dephospho-CoA kinase n=1 Tax=Intrasporangium sp. TaxID=1925024 RepID=UPI002D771D12|nr:dephospho-CoA kinase [Intrasporangium sp.]HET7398434.1 dephospho-CoA kinase [Intrasporangium sp.]
MLRVGVTGGIGSGKSTAARRLAELGACVVDADVVAREVVEPGTPALRLIRERFGDEVIRPEGDLDRARLAGIVFHDAAALRDLEAITGPSITEGVARLRANTPPGVVSVFDMPLLVERRLWVHEHLAVVVGAHVETRVRRLVEQRGLGEEDVRARIAAQATDDDRRAAADVWLDNDAGPDDLLRLVDAVWHDRIAPFNANVVGGIRASRPELGAVVDPRADWAARGRRTTARIEAALARDGIDVDVEHIGSTAVPGLLAKDVIDVQVGVPSIDRADGQGLAAALRRAGYVRVREITRDTPHPEGADAGGWVKRFYGGCDPGNLVHVHVRERGSAGWRFALLFRDWLIARPDEREAYAAEKRRLLALDPRTSAYVEGKEPWFSGAYERASAWARETGWTPTA